MTAALTEGSEDYDPTKALALVEVDIFDKDCLEKGHSAILGDENCDA